MSFLDRIFRRRDSMNGEKRGYPYWLLDNDLTSNKSMSGVTVTPDTAITNMAVYAAIRIIAESIASLPFVVYEREPNGGKHKSAGHPMYRLLHDSPNREQTAFSFRETMSGHVLTHGNAIAEIERDQAGRPIALWPLRPDRFEMERVDGRLKYIYRSPNGFDKTLDSFNVLHIAGLGFDGLQGYSPIRLAREAIGLNLAAETFGNSFFGNAARPSGVLQHPGHLTEEGAQRLRKSWGEVMSGAQSAGKTAILEEGMAWTTIGIPNDDAQWLQTRQFGIQEIARLYRVPPHMLSDLSRATFTNIEHQGLEFVVHTLRPWLVRWEQECNRKLFRADSGSFCEFIVDGLLRGDVVSRFNAYKIGRDGGWFSINDIRQKENLNPIGAGGDTYIMPMNMAPVDQVVSDPDMSRELDDDEKAEASPPAEVAGALLDELFHGLLEDAAERTVRVECNALRRAVAKHLEKSDDGQTFLTWLHKFYAEHVGLVRGAFGPTVRALAIALDRHGIDCDALADQLADRIVGEGRRQVVEIVRESTSAIEAAEEIRNTIVEWTDELPPELARKEYTRLTAALADVE